MPLLDHFHPPLHPYRSSESFFTNWATRLADALTLLVPEDFQVEEHIHAGPNLEIDVAAYESKKHENGAAMDEATAWLPTPAPQTMPAVFPESFEVRVFSTIAGLSLVAAIELISPGNKDRAEQREAFAIKCQSYLQRGVSLIIIDVVTNRHANLHNEIVGLLKAAGNYDMPADANLYAVAYRPVVRGERSEIDIWPTTISLGEALPVLPLRLTGDLFVPVDFEAAYREACQRRRLA